MEIKKLLYWNFLDKMLFYNILVELNNLLQYWIEMNLVFNGFLY